MIQQPKHACEGTSFASCTRPHSNTGSDRSCCAEGAADPYRKHPVRSPHRQTILQLRTVVEDLVSIEEEERNDDRAVVALLQPVGQSLQLGVQVATEHQVHVQHHIVRRLDVADAQIPQQVDGKHGMLHRVHQRGHAFGKMNGRQQMDRATHTLLGRGDDDDVATRPAREDLWKHEESRGSA